MRSVDPLTLKLHKKENWINLITFNNFSLDLQRISYLNKIVNFYFTKRHDILAGLKTVELKKKIYVEANIGFFSFLRKKKYKYFFKKFLSFRNKRKKFLFSTFFEKNFKLRSFDFMLPNKNFYKKAITSCFFFQKHIKKISIRNLKKKKKYQNPKKTKFKLIISKKIFQQYTKLIQRIHLRARKFIYIIRIFQKFFLYKVFIENFLQNKLYKRIILRPKFFFVKYFSKRYRKFISSFGLNQQIRQFVKKSKQNLKKRYYLKKKRKFKHRKSNFFIMLKALSTGLIYNEPELFLKGIISAMHQNTKHRQLYRILYDVITNLARIHNRSIKLLFNGRFLIRHSERTRYRSISAGPKISVQNFSKKIYYGAAIAKTYAGVVNIRLWWI